MPPQKLKEGGFCRSEERSGFPPTLEKLPYLLSRRTNSARSILRRLR